MLHPVRGVLAVEGVQTGDGRLIVENALTWVDPPLPLAWLRDGDQHVDLIEVAPQIGTIETITRVGQLIEWTGQVDDEIEDGAEAIRRMTAGSAPLGERFGISIDPDDYEVEIILTDPDETSSDTTDDELVSRGTIVASAAVTGADLGARLRRRARVAAAGEGDPGDDGVLLFEAASDEMIERYTRMRIRGATCCAVGAFGEAFMELDGTADDSDDAPADDTAEPEAVAASAAGACSCGGHGAAVAASPRRRAAVIAAAGLTIPVAPPRSWFDPEPTLLRSLRSEGVGTIRALDNGRVFGYVAPGNAALDPAACHIGYVGSCETVDDLSINHFHVGYVVCDDGTELATGSLTFAGTHAPLSDAHGRPVTAAAALAHYEDVSTTVADIRVGRDEFGLWCAGALDPSVTPEQLRRIRGSAPSYDARPIGTALEIINVHYVTTPGHPMRERVQTRVADGRLVAVIASGGAVHEPVARVTDADLAALIGRERKVQQSRLQTRRRELVVNRLRR